MTRDYDSDAIPAVYNLLDQEPRRDDPGFKQVVFRGIDQLIGFSQVGPAKADEEPHAHPEEQLNMVVDGRMAFLVDGERVELEPYDTLMIPPEIPHTARAIDGEEAILLAFWPLREAFLEGTDYQTEFPEL